MQEQKTKFRIYFIFGAFCVVFALILSKAAYIQIFQKEKLLSYLNSQILRQYEVYPFRGNIYDRNKSPLAINVQTYSIFTIPKTLKNKQKSLRGLSKIVPKLSYSKLLSKIKNRKRYTWLARKMELTKEQVAQIKKVKGIYIDSVPKRLYPNHELLSQTLGFVGVDNSGLAGIEYNFDKDLKGEPIVAKYIKDAKGRAIKFESEKRGKEGEDIYLSVDKDLQAFAEKTLKEAVLHHKADKGGIGVMDANTGEILAVANYPTFDPAKIRKSTREFRKLSFISDPFEPGSTFKVLTVISALENKIARPDTNYYCEKGKLEVQGHIINEAEAKKKHEWLSVSEILKYSSNIGTTKIAFDLTYPRLKKTLDKFEIGKKSNIEIPGESRGIFTEDFNVSSLSLSNISFGQGVATTGVQMLKVYAAIANGGYLIQPTILKTDKPILKEKIISEKITNELTHMLVDAVEVGTGGNAKVDFLKIAGKTSTAQRVDEKGGYQGYVSGFIGYPVGIERPFVVYVYIDNPKENGYYGNVAAAPVFKKVTQYKLLKNKSFKKLAIKDKRKLNLDRVKIKQAAARYKNGSQIPNFLGLDKRSTLKLAKKFNLKVKSNGFGVVRKQSPPAFSVLRKEQEVTLWYRPPEYD